MSTGFLLIDGNNLGHIANNAQALKVGSQPTQAIYGMLRILRPMFNTFNMLTPVVLWDGASWRKDLFAAYKESREKEPTAKHELAAADLRQQFKQQQPLIRQALELLGVRQMLAINYEADDLAAMIVNKAIAGGKKAIMITGDKDWVQLLGKGVAWLDPVHSHRLTPDTLPFKLGYNPDKKKVGVYDGRHIAGWMGVPSPRAWLEMKCLMGDTSDDIPGVGGIGEKRAIEFVCTYPSVVDFMNQCIDKTIDTSKLPSHFAKLADDMEKRDNYWRNVMLMELNYKGRPAPSNLRTNYGKFDPDGFARFCEQFQFNSILSQIDKWVEPFQPLKAAA